MFYLILIYYQDAVNKAIPTEPTPAPVPQIGPQIGPQLSASTSTSSNMATETPEVYNPFRAANLAATASSSVENSRTSSPPIMVDDSPTPPVRMGKVFYIFSGLFLPPCSKCPGTTNIFRIYSIGICKMCIFFKS